MATSLKQPLCTFIASPGDVAKERARLASVVEQLNRRVADNLGGVLESQI